MASIGFSGGAKLEAILRDTAKKLGEGKLLRVGFLETEKYPDGTPVAQVAFWDEYGTQTAPPRPFFRGLIAAKSGRWGAALGSNLAATGYDVDKTLNIVGGAIKDQLTKSIIDFTSPGNAASTIAKKGFNAPLRDTGQMLKAPAFDIQGES